MPHHHTARLTTLFLFLFTIVSSAAAQDELIHELHGLLGELGSRRVEDRAAARDRFEAACYPLGAPGHPDRAQVMQTLASWLDEPGTKFPAKIFLLRILERVGGDEVVPALQQQLTSSTDGVRESARRALANNPSDQASAALMEQFRQSKQPREQRNLLAAIQYRARPADRPFLEQVARESKGNLRLAAITALGSLPGTSASKGPVARAQHREALLRTAEKIARTQGSDAALPIYQDLYASLPTESRFRLAALQGVLTHEPDPDQRTQIILSILTADEAQPMEQVAVSQIRGLPASGLAQLLKALPTFRSELQSQVVTAVGTQPEQAVLPRLIELLKSSPESLRPAVISALGDLGDATTVATLLPLLRADEATNATASLTRLRGDGVNPRLLEAFRETDSAAIRLALLQVFHARRVTEAIPSVLEHLGSANPELRQRAWQLATRLGQASDVEPLLIALRQRSGSERDRAEKALVNLCRRLPEQARPVVTYYEQAPLSQQRDVLPLLGRIGDASALATIRQAAHDHQHALHAEAVAALSNWPNDEVAEDLLRIVRNPRDNSMRTRALRAYARVAVLGGTDEKKLNRLQTAFQAAERDAERELAIERAKAVRTRGSLEFVLPHLASESLGSRARRTVVDLAHHRQVREANEEAFNEALRRVLQLSDDAGLRERAQKYLAE